MLSIKRAWQKYVSPVYLTWHKAQSNRHLTDNNLIPFQKPLFNKTLKTGQSLGCELEGSPFLEAGVKGLIPFTPLMKPPPGMKDQEWLRHCVEVADAVEQDSVSKADYLTDLAILGGLIFAYSTVRQIIMEAIMQESSVIQHFLQQGREQGIERGTRESLIEGILENLEFRFKTHDLQIVAARLERIDAVQRLKELRREALHAVSFEAFQRTLGLSGDTNGNDAP